MGITFLGIVERREAGLTSNEPGSTGLIPPGTVLPNSTRVNPLFGRLSSRRYPLHSGHLYHLLLWSTGNLISVVQRGQLLILTPLNSLFSSLIIIVLLEKLSPILVVAISYDESNFWILLIYEPLHLPRRP